jgi:hypothetical protein
MTRSPDRLFFPRFIDNDASLLLVMLRCLRFNPVNSSQISSIMQSSPLVSLVAEIHKGCTQNKKRPQLQTKI